MRIAVASGKGGTGKTTIATHLAVTAARSGRSTAYLDCDVEEPNGRIFLKPTIEETADVTVPVPLIDMVKCTLCRDCSAACAYNALAVLVDTVKVFPSLCHGCGGCADVCQEGAINEYRRPVGSIACGYGQGVEFLEGRLNVGEALAPPVTRALRRRKPQAEVVILDAPPGTSCPVIEAINDTDYVLLVTEPTPFGLSDLKLAVGMVRALGLPFGVIINRADIGDDRTVKYCCRQDIEILGQLPFDLEVAQTYSRGDLMFDSSPDYETDFRDLFKKIAIRIQHDRACCC